MRRQTGTEIPFQAAMTRQAGRILPFIIIGVLCSSPFPAEACQVEYSDFLIDIFRQQGMALDKRVGDYGSLAECEAAIRQAVSQSGDPSLANHMLCVGCSSSPTPGSPSSSPSSPSPTSPSPVPAPASPSIAEMERRERERREAFETDRSKLLGTLRGDSSSAGGLSFRKTSVGSGLPLKDGSTAQPVKADTGTESALAREMQEARARITELQRGVSGIQTILGQYTKSLINNSAETTKWGDLVDEAYTSVLDNSKSYFLGLFLKYSLLGGFRKVQKTSFGELGRYLKTPDSKIQAWLRSELGGRRLDADKLEKLVELGQAEGDFAALLQTEDDARKYLDSLILVSDLLQIVGRDVPGGELFQQAQVIGATYADLSAIGYSWFSLDRLAEDRDKLATEVSSLSFRMRRSMTEINCLETCMADYGEGCMDRCAGRTRLHSPPPLPR